MFHSFIKLSSHLNCEELSLLWTFWVDLWSLFYTANKFFFIARIHFYYWILRLLSAKAASESSVYPTVTSPRPYIVNAQNTFVTLRWVAPTILENISHKILNLQRQGVRVFLLPYCTSRALYFSLEESSQLD